MREHDPRFLPQSDPIYIMTDGRPMSPRHPTNLFCESGKRASFVLQTLVLEGEFSD